LGRDAATQGRVGELTRLAQRCLVRLAEQAETPERIRREVFYRMVLAEARRDADAMPHREAAAELGGRLTAAGQFNPFRIYMAIVSATDQAPTTGNFGDITTAPAPRIRTGLTRVDELGFAKEFDLVLPAAGLDQSHLNRFATFLSRTLSEIAESHGLLN